MDILIRSVILFILLLIGTRIMGRKQISEMTFFDYAIGITIGSIVASASIDAQIKFIDGIIATLVWVGASLITGWINLKSFKIRRLTNGEPLIIIKNGIVNIKNMSKSRYNVDDLLMQLREKDVFNLNEVDIAILEIDGTLTVLKKPEFNNVTLKDLNIKKLDNNLMLAIIIDGIIIDDNLSEYNKDKLWLKSQLKFRKINDISKVIYAGLTPNGELKIIKKD